MNKKTGYLLTKNEQKKVNKSNITILATEFMFTSIFVFSGYLLAHKLIGGFFATYLLAVIIFGEGFYKATEGIIRPFWRVKRKK